MYRVAPPATNTHILGRHVLSSWENVYSSLHHDFQSSSLTQLDLTSSCYILSPREETIHRRLVTLINQRKTEYVQYVNNCPETKPEWVINYRCPDWRWNMDFCCCDKQPSIKPHDIKLNIKNIANKNMQRNITNRSETWELWDPQHQSRVSWPTLEQSQQVWIPSLYSKAPDSLGRSYFNVSLKTLWSRQKPEGKLGFSLFWPKNSKHQRGQWAQNASSVLLLCI